MGLRGQCRGVAFPLLWLSLDSAPTPVLVLTCQDPPGQSAVRWQFGNWNNRAVVGEKIAIALKTPVEEALSAMAFPQGRPGVK